MEGERNRHAKDHFYIPLFVMVESSMAGRKRMEENREWKRTDKETAGAQ